MHPKMFALESQKINNQMTKKILNQVDMQNVLQFLCTENRIIYLQCTIEKCLMFCKKIMMNSLKSFILLKFK